MKIVYSTRRNGPNTYEVYASVINKTVFRGSKKECETYCEANN